MTGASKQRVAKVLKKGQFILFIKKEHYKQSVHVGKWIAKELSCDSLSPCDIPPHEFCQMLNHDENPIALHWSHFNL